MTTRTGALLVAASALGRMTSSSASGVGVCQPQRRVACETAYLDCKLTFPVSDQDAICGCAAVYYAACLPTAGCGSTKVMTSCIDELMTLDCPDMSVCGNDCTVDDGDPLVPADSIYLPINNFGANYLQLSVCSKNLSAAKLTHFGQVTMERCGEGDFRTCSLWVAPRALTVVTFPPHVTYLRVERCVIHAAVSGDDDDDDDGDHDGKEEEEEAHECLDEPLPMEFYGTTGYFEDATTSTATATTAAAAADKSNTAVSSVSHWPSSVDVDYSDAVICQKDSHCPGSFCDLQQQPRACAPKIGEHFVQSGSHFLDPRWKLLEGA